MFASGDATRFAVEQYKTTARHPYRRNASLPTFEDANSLNKVGEFFLEATKGDSWYQTACLKSVAGLGLRQVPTGLAGTRESSGQQQLLRQSAPKPSCNLMEHIYSENCSSCRTWLV